MVQEAPVISYVIGVCEMISLQLLIACFGN